MTRKEIEAADLLRRLLEAVENGELTANGAQGKRLLRRIEGAIAGIEAASEASSGKAAKKPRKNSP